MDDTTAILTLTVEDVQQVAKDVLSRELIQKEMTFVEDHIDEYVSWYNGIQDCILTNFDD